MLATTSTALSAVELGFARLTEQPNPLLFDARPVPGLPDRPMPLDELRSLLVANRFDADVTDALWRQLSCHVREWAPEWVTAAAGIALPGLTRMAAKISRGHPGEADDIDSEMLAAFLQALREAPLQPPRLWLRLCWAAWRAGVAVVKTEPAEELPPDRATGARSPLLPYGHPELILGRAAAAGIITAAQAELIADTRLGDTLIEQLAAQAGLSAPVLRMRRRRAERLLAAALIRGDLTVAACGTAGSRAVR